MSYCIDTSSLIECWARSYPIDLFPGLWDRLDSAARDGELIAPDEVLHELAKDFAQRTHADPFVIAVARLHGMPIITQEGPGSEKRPTIPSVCRSLGIRTLTILEFVREKGWTFQ